MHFMGSCTGIYRYASNLLNRATAAHALLSLGFNNELVPFLAVNRSFTVGPSLSIYMFESMRSRFGVKWSKVLEDGLVFNALDGAKKLGISTDEVGKKWETLKKGEGIIKFGGGFYCGKVDSIYVSWIAGRW